MAATETSTRRGLYRVEGIDGAESWAQVDDPRDGMPAMPFDEHVYRARGYEPPFETLPTRAEYLAGVGRSRGG
ncbi:MAG: hypothetical protein AAF683_03715 [Pseudomonadota bacterium]